MIPKKIHYCWFGNGPKNELFYKCLESWKKYCPDYEIIEWNESNYDVTKNQYMLEAYQAKRWGFVSDYARLDIVYNHGGIYLDTDVEMVKPFDDLLELKGFAGFEMPDRASKAFAVNTGSGFGAEKNNAIIKKMRDEYEGVSFINSDGMQNLTPSPKFNSEGLEKCGFTMNGEKQAIDGFTVFPAVSFCPLNWANKKGKIGKETYSIHHFDVSWLTEDEKKKRARERRRDIILHFPNRCLMKLLGKSKYESFKKKIRK